MDWYCAEYYSVWILAVRHFGGIYYLIYDWKDMSHGKSPCKEVSVLVFLYFVYDCKVNFEEIFLYSTLLNTYIVPLGSTT